MPKGNCPTIAIKRDDPCVVNNVLVRDSVNRRESNRVYAVSDRSFRPVLGGLVKVGNEIPEGASASFSSRFSMLKRIPVSPLNRAANDPSPLNPAVKRLG
jgi:hypothetical protein